jgi:hypothetical protein
VVKNRELGHAEDDIHAPAGEVAFQPMNRRPTLTIFAPDASEEEAAAIVAALEQFMRQTAPVPVAPPHRRNPWQLAALHEGVSREPVSPLPWA